MRRLSTGRTGRAREQARSWGLASLLLLLATGAVFGLEVAPPQNVLVARGILYRGIVGTSGGKLPYKYRLLEGPGGLELDPATGTVCWTPGDMGPEDTGACRVRVQVTDAAGDVVTAEFSLITHDLVPLGSAVPAFGSAVVHGEHIFCLDAHGLTVRPLDNLLAVVGCVSRHRCAFSYSAARPPNAIALAGDRLAASWEKSLALFTVSPSGGLALQGTVPCADQVQAVAAHDAEVAMADRRSLAVLEVNAKGVPLQVACCMVDDVEEMRFVEDGLVFRDGAGTLSFLQKKGAEWAGPSKIGTDVGRILAAHGEMVAVLSKQGAVSIVAPSAGAEHALGVPSLRPDDGAWAFWDDKGLFLPHVGKRFLASVKGGRLVAEEDKTFSPRVPLMAIGETLLQVAGPTKLRLAGQEPVVEEDAEAQPKEEPAADAPFLFGLSGDVRVALGEGVLGWYEQGRVGAVIGPAGAEPKFLEAPYAKRIPKPTTMLVSSSGMCLETAKGWWWADWRKPDEASVRYLGTFDGANAAGGRRDKSSRQAVLLGDCLVYVSQAAPTELHLLAAGAEVPDVQVTRANAELRLLAKEDERKIVYVLDSKGALHVYRLDGEKLAEVASATFDFPQPLADAVALTGSRQYLTAVGANDFWIIDTSQPEKPGPVGTWRHDWFLPGKSIAALGSMVFADNTHNTGQSLCALDTEPARNKEGFARVACHRGPGMLTELTAADGLLLADFRSPAPSFLFASDAGYRSRKPGVSPSLSLRNATLVRKALSIFKKGQRDEAGALLAQAFAVEGPGAAFIGFEHWEMLWAAPQEVRARMLVGNFLDDHVGSHLNSHLSTQGDPVVADVINRAVCRRGWSQDYRREWLRALSKGEPDPGAVRALWHAAASPDGPLCGGGFEALISRGSEGTAAALVALYPRASVEAIPHLSRALAVGRVPEAKGLIWARWKDLGDVTNDRDLGRYLETASAVSKLNTPAFADLVAPMLDDGDPKAVARAARIAGQLGDAEAVKPLEALLMHDAGQVQGESALALLELGRPLVVAALRGGLADREKEFATRAITVFKDRKYRGNKEALEVVREVLRDTAWDKVDQLIRYHAMWSLAQIGQKEDAELVANLEADNNPHVKGGAQHVREAILRELERAAGVAAIPIMRPPKPRELPSLEEYQKEVASLKDADWQKQDPVNEQLTWCGVAGGIALADAENREVYRFPNLFGFDEMKVNGIAFGADKVWLATSKGLMAWDRELGSWSRYAPTFDMMDAPAASVELTENGAVRVKVQEQGGKARVFVFDPKAEKWGEEQ